MRRLRENFGRDGRGFTIVELLIVVAVIVLLIGILIPSLGKVHERALRTQTISTLGAIQTGLQGYFADFNMYPPSGGAYGGITAKRGSAMLAQGLMGYLDAGLDGAGPSNSDPQYGFRTRTMGVMGRVGEVKGPYVTPEAKTLKRFELVDHYFVDAWSAPVRVGSKDFWNHEILYFRSTRAPGADLTKLPDPTALPGKIFGTGTITLANDYYFDTADCAAELDEKGVGIIPSPVSVPVKDSSGFFTQIEASSNTSFGNVTGARSYLLVSAGPDGKYFTSDDIVYSKQ